MDRLFVRLCPLCATILKRVSSESGSRIYGKRRVLCILLKKTCIIAQKAALGRGKHKHALVMCCLFPGRSNCATVYTLGQNPDFTF